MVLARAYEVIEKELHGKNKQVLRSGIVREAKCQCCIGSWAELKTRYDLNIIEFPDENPAEYEQTLWKFIKVLRDALSHVDYHFDDSSGSTANQPVKFLHIFREETKLHMEVPLDRLFQMTEHMGVWIDCALQKNKLVEVAT